MKRILMILLFFQVTFVFAREQVFYLERIKGQVEYRKTAQGEWKRVHERMPIFEGYQLRTGKNSTVVIRISPYNYSVMGENSEITIEEGKAIPEKEGNILTKLRREKSKVYLKQKKGSMYFLLDGLNRESSFQVETPTAVAGARGTWFSTVFDSEKGGVTQIAVLRGKVDVSPTQASAGWFKQAQTLTSGQALGMTYEKKQVSAPSNVPPNQAQIFTQGKVITTVVSQNPQTQLLQDSVKESSEQSLNLSNLTIANTSFLTDSLSSFLSNSLTYDDLDSYHPIENGTISWKMFTKTDIENYLNTLDSSSGGGGGRF